MQPFWISQNELARVIGVPPRRINEIVLGKRAISPDTALGLEDVFCLPAMYWLTLQARYDLASARERQRLGVSRTGYDPLRHSPPDRETVEPALDDWEPM